MFSNSENLDQAANKAQGSTASHLRNLISKITGPMRKEIEDDRELLDKTAHVRKPKEPMMSFHARTGLGAAQIRSMSKSEISNFVAVATNNAQHEEHLKEQKGFETSKVMPTRFIIT